MAKEALRPPIATHPVVEDNKVMTTPWYRFMQLVARHLLNIAGVEPVSSADIAAPPAAVATTDVAALTDPLVTSADATAAGVGYVQAQAASVVTLVNEIKADVNTIVTRQNLDAVLTNEIKAKVNEIDTYLATVRALANENKARINEIHDLLNQ